ncbi:hypothetical protein ANCCEY_00252 [Ancylostoma ceylanicum]|uniref:Uncharacterized protein n=1 Tax=Ancylostoma ceylanicum TaxID=53326 RepID=A0A0D6M940_9BILA|nr:hypothetical protein ANCCEY_00252 [Ancylostoma ceylanicum]
MKDRIPPRLCFIAVITLVAYLVFKNNFKEEPAIEVQHHEDIVGRIKDGTYDTAPFNESKLISAFFRYNEGFHHSEGGKYYQHCHILLFKQQDCIFGGQPKDQQRNL